MAGTVWLVKGREDSPWPLQAYKTYEAAHEASALMHGTLGDESAFVRPVNVYGSRKEDADDGK